MARKRSRYHGITSISLGGLYPVSINDSVKVMDVLAGAAVGVAGSALLKGLLNKFDFWTGGSDPTKGIKATLGKAVPLVTGLATGLVLYYAQRNMDESRGKGHLVGAVAAGAASSALAALPEYTKDFKDGSGKPYFDFSDVVSLNLGYLGNYGGLLVNDASDQFNGLLVNDKSDSLNQLAAYSMGEDHDEDGLMALSVM